MTLRLTSLLCASLACPGGSGCDRGKTSAESPREEASPAGPDQGQEDRRLNQGYGLLYDLMSNESDVGKVFILKDASDQTKEIVKTIARVSGEARKRLESFDEADPALRLDHLGLPEVEVKTREAISKATAKQLLLGKDFELHLILTQFRASQYAAFLARAIAERDPVKQRKEWLEGLSKQFDELSKQTTDRLAVKK